MNLSRTLFIIFLFLACGKGMVCAQHFMTAEVRNSFYIPPSHQHYTIAKGNTNELQYLFSGLFLLYKFAISSQDYNRCNFSPSCSEYGMIAVKKYGVLPGIIATLDRLQRCNGLSPELYPYDMENHLSIDPP